MYESTHSLVALRNACPKSIKTTWFDGERVIMIFFEVTQNDLMHRFRIYLALLGHTEFYWMSSQKKYVRRNTHELFYASSSSWCCLGFNGAVLWVVYMACS